MTLNSINTSDRTITLRNSSPNLFDIDSISLLIGKNGSGKTFTLQSIIRAFNPRRKELLGDSCKLFFDHGRAPSKDELNRWGIIYYTPAQNRPGLNSVNNFLDASKRKIENLFNLERYMDVLGAFDLKLELTATIKGEYKKIVDLLADALIKNKNFRSSEIQTKFDFNEANKLRIKLDETSDFEASQEEYDAISQSYAKQQATLSRIILKSIELSNTDERVFSCLATVTYMAEKKKAGITTIIEFIRAYLGSNIFSPLKISRFQLEPFLLLANATIDLINDFEFKRSSGSRVFYSRHLATPEDRIIIENSPAFALCYIDFPAISSGQWAIMKQTIAIYESLRDLSKKENIENILLLIDEGDAFLHLEWQRRYIMQLNAFLSRCKSELNIGTLQLILASHSPLLATDMPRDFVCAFDSDKPQPSFAAPLQLILNRSFSSRSIGEFATREINSTIQRAKAGRLDDKDRYIIDLIDDPIIKREIHHIIAGNENNDN